SHSLVVCCLMLLFVWFILRSLPIFLLAWPIHIIIDIPTHSRYFLPTPFLWPISDWRFPGFSWGQWWFMLLNWSAIIIALIFVIIKKRIEVKKLKRRNS
ncbi:MAG: hypothetical protein N3D84_03680, partial [Candidatus Woesearchaeota archaeon]|nr:hypothetical protein [Candidatus Woesearchaeota archaeon]